MSTTEDALVRRARKYATEAHRRIHQTRKFTGKPYEVHLKSVAEIVRQVADDPALVAAAWLHDVVEDTPATLDDVEREFGPHVAGLVEQLTDVSRPSDGNREKRVAINRQHTAQASAGAKTVKLADLLDNCRDICAHDPRFAPTYLAEMASLLDVLGDGDARLMRRCRTMLNDCSGKLGLGKVVSSRHRSEDPFDRWVSTKHPGMLRRFARAFVAGDLAEPLRGSDIVQPATLRSDQVLDVNAPLSDVIEALTRHDVCFVVLDGTVGGMIRREDIQKPVGRTWLFGLITMFELYLTKQIRDLWPGDSWTSLLSPARLRQAEGLRAERLRRQHTCELLDCLQIADKGSIFVRNPAQLAAFGFASRRSAEHVMREIQSLRNNLAHAQDIVVIDWPQIVRLARRLETIVALGVE